MEPQFYPISTQNSPIQYTTTSYTPVTLPPVNHISSTYNNSGYSAPLLRTEVVHHNDWVWYLVVLVVVIMAILIFVLIFWLGYSRTVTWKPIFGSSSVTTDIFNAKDRSIYVGGTGQVLLLTITLETSSIGAVFGVRNIGTNQINVKAQNFSINPANNLDGTVVRPGQLAQFMVTDPFVVIRL